MKKEQSYYSLEGSFLYDYCLPEWQIAINNNKEDRLIKKGAVLFAEGDRVEGVFFVYSGLIKIHQHWGNEKELIIRFAKAGDMIGYRGLGPKKIYTISATALTDGAVCFITIPFFEATLQVNPGFTYALMNFYADELQETEKRMRNMAHMEVKGRIAAMFLMLKKQFGINKQGIIKIALAKQDLASYAGTTYETLFRMTNDLIKEELIEMHGRHIAILNEPGLIQLINSR